MIQVPGDATTSHRRPGAAGAPQPSSPLEGDRVRIGNAHPALKILFFTEMALSPVLAGGAFIVPDASHWGAFKYIPAVVWLVMLVQCLAVFRRRGLWFLLGPPVATVAIVAFLVGAQLEPQRFAVPSVAATHSDSSPMITANPDGTFTVRKTPPNGISKDAKTHNGLVIPAQVVAPIFSSPEGKH
jgi:hypothetical protein